MIVIAIRVDTEPIGGRSRRMAIDAVGPEFICKVWAVLFPNLTSHKDKRLVRMLFQNSPIRSISRSTRK